MNPNSLRTSNTCDAQHCGTLYVTNDRMLLCHSQIDRSLDYPNIQQKAVDLANAHRWTIAEASAVVCVLLFTKGYRVRPPDVDEDTGSHGVRKHE